MKKYLIYSAIGLALSFLAYTVSPNKEKEQEYSIGGSSSSSSSGGGFNFSTK